MRKPCTTILAILLTGCQTTSYEQYAIAMARIAEAKASVQREQAQALIALAHGGDTTAKTVAVIMLGIGAGGGVNGGSSYPNPQPPQNEALQWAQVLLPTVATLGLGYWGYKLGTHQSDNAADVSIAGYNAMFGIANSGFNTVTQFKPQPFDWSAIGNLRPNNTTTTTINNRDGNVIQGTGEIAQDNSPVVVVPPVVVTNP